MIPKIGQTLLIKRRELRLTQEEVAEYLAVSKASVSKWETGQSFPDTLLIPQLANFFNITIDELFGYTPGISTNDIKILYEEYGHRFVKGNDPDLIKDIEENITKYYAYPQFILSISQWFLNYATIEKDTIKQTQMINKAYSLAKHVLEITNNSSFLSLAEMLCTTILLYQKKYKECFEIVGEEPKIVNDAASNNLLASIYLSLGKIEKAKQVSQVNIFQNISVLLESLVNYQAINSHDKELHDIIYQQVKAVIDNFDMQEILCNPIFTTHLIAANSSILNNNHQEAITRLYSYYQRISKTKFPLSLNKSDYFHHVNDWIEENSYLGSITPVTQEQVKTNFCDAVLENPMFDVLKEFDSYQQLIKKLKEFKNG